MNDGSKLEGIKQLALMTGNKNILSAISTLPIVFDTHLENDGDGVFEYSFDIKDKSYKAEGITIDDNLDCEHAYLLLSHEAWHWDQFVYRWYNTVNLFTTFETIFLSKRACEIDARLHESEEFLKLYQNNIISHEQAMTIIHKRPDNFSTLAMGIAKAIRERDIERNIKLAGDVFQYHKNDKFTPEQMAKIKAEQAVYLMNSTGITEGYFDIAMRKCDKIFEKVISNSKEDPGLYSHSRNDTNELLYAIPFKVSNALDLLGRHDQEKPFISLLSESNIESISKSLSYLTPEQEQRNNAAKEKGQNLVAYIASL